MHKQRTIFAAVFLAAAPCVATALPVEVPNPGAEVPAADGSGRPEGSSAWSSSGVDCEFRRDTAQPHSGEASYYVRHGGAGHSGPSSAIYIINGPVVTGLNYTATAWIKCRNVHEAGLRMRPKSADGKYVDAHTDTYKYDTVKGTQDWKKITCTWSAVPGVAQFDLFLAVSKGGEAWFDDIEVHDDFEDEVRMGELRGLAGDLATALSDVRSSNESDMPVVAEARTRLDALHSEASAYLERVHVLLTGGSVPHEIRARRSDLIAALSRSKLEAQRLVGLARVADQRGQSDSAIMIGWASPTDHVFLRDCPVPWRPDPTGRILAVRGETEALQLVVVPLRHDVQNVRVRVGTLRGDGDNAIACTAITVRPVGFVKTNLVPTNRVVPIEHEYLGWWPDPLIETDRFDLKRGDAQPVWVAIQVPRSQAAGVYRGVARIEADNAPAIEAPLEVRVADCVLPDSNPWAFRNLLSWWHVPPEQFYGERWSEELQRKFFDFLLDRRINVLSMYGNAPYETLENIKRFAARGQNVFLLDWYTQNAVISTSDASQLRQRLNRFLPTMRRLGLIDRAYVYGWDEIGEPGVHPGIYEEVRLAGDILTRKYPGVRLISAGTDRTYGTNSPLAGLTNVSYCPDIGQGFNQDLARRSQASGNHVWWYDTHWNIEQHLIRSRLIPWQTFKLGADGFLMWCLNRWKNNTAPLDGKILTDWNPLLDGVCPSSSAMYVYPGQDGPVSSLRLENFRDGIEDYELLMAARRMLERTDLGGAREMLQRAVEISDEMTSDLRDYTTDSNVLFDHRRRLIEALEEVSAAGGE